MSHKFRLLALILALVMVVPMAVNAQEIWKPYDENGKALRTDRDAVGENGVVASSNFYASRAGLEVLEKGGNAIDAAIATAYALGVVEPYTSGLGGGGFMLIHSAETGEDVFIDFRERAPLLATPALWAIDEDGKVIGSQTSEGGKSVGVPGEVAGLEYALEQYGTLPRAEVMQPAIDLATEGYLVSLNMNTAATDSYEYMLKYPELGHYYLAEGGLPYETGELFQNPDLAKTLKMIAENGKDAFYKGEVAEAFVETVQKYGSVMTLKDLEAYEIKVREPVRSTYRGYQLISAPPASSGGTHLIEILNILENFDLPNMEVNSAPYLHLFSEAFKLAFADRSAYMSDTDFQDVPLEGLTNKDYAKLLSEKIDVEKSQAYTADDPYKYQSGSTTHLSIADKAGNMVAVTKTINYFWGSKIAIAGYGFIANDEMDDFVPGTESVNRIEGGKRPLSSMTPTVILTAEGNPFMTVGSPGGLRIFPTVAQVVSHVIDHDMTIQEAIDTPRIFDNAGNKINYESGENGLKPETVKALEDMGHEMVERGEWDLYFGGVQGIVYREDGTLHGGADPRRDGKAVGF
ncbi:MAG: gamma-glutamyltransferase [Eubacteriales bacterium]|nr:gamma-glutamyltransferase [Eubacteriales bacterium]MDD4105795.1 gamma-glutamyltransferase [Eubacteriales bacterium]MDD4711042.1 gamma-glutamyltransferase [Eubacteriales bacterium]